MALIFRPDGRAANEGSGEGGEAEEAGGAQQVGEGETVEGGTREGKGLAGAEADPIPRGDPNRQGSLAEVGRVGGPSRGKVEHRRARSHASAGIYTFIFDMLRQGPLK